MNRLVTNGGNLNKRRGKMKKLVTMLVLLGVVFSGIAFAQDSLNITEVLQKIPELKQGVMYSVLDKEVNYISTFKVLEWKNIGFEAGYAYDNSLVGVVSYPFFKMKDFGVTIPVLDLIECNLGVGVGIKRLNVEQDMSGSGNNEFDFGITATLINVKF